MIHRLIISAPFGNWLNFKNATSTVGTFTHDYRGGTAYRLWRCLRTLRYSWRSQGWINKLGLPNPGIEAISGDNLLGKIVSIHGFNMREWEELAARCVLLPQVETVELNLSCPNVGHSPSIKEVEGSLHGLIMSGTTVVAKLPPVKWMDYARPLYALGVWHFHCFNTIPTPGGGLSGKPLMQYSLWAVEELRKEFGDKVILIGGGGISSTDDIKRYRDAGADHFAMQTRSMN